MDALFFIAAILGAVAYALIIAYVMVWMFGLRDGQNGKQVEEEQAT